jgi:hypothetical protein
MNRFASGVAAGALGTLALDMVTYLDVAVRGRGLSSVPADSVGRLAASLGVPLARAGDEDRAEHRRTGIGALGGYLVGLGVGAAYGLVGPALNRRPVPLAALCAGGMAMAAGDLPAVLSGSTDPRKWGVSGWLSDIVPHVAYGVATAAAFDWIWRHR